MRNERMDVSIAGTCAHLTVYRDGWAIIRAGKKGRGRVLWKCPDFRTEAGRANLRRMAHEWATAHAVDLW